MRDTSLLWMKLLRLVRFRDGGIYHLFIMVGVCQSAWNIKTPFPGGGHFISLTAVRIPLNK